jgi:cell division protein FtsX
MSPGKDPLRPLGVEQLLADQIGQHLPGEDLDQTLVVESLRIVTAEEAMERFQASFPDLKDVLDNLKVNPFPASIEAFLQAEKARPEAVAAGAAIGWMGSLTSVSKFLKA